MKTLGIVLPIMFVLAASYAFADEPVHYCDSKDGKTRVIDFPPEVIGPGYRCKLTNGKSAGTGLSIWDANCKGRKSGKLIIDMTHDYEGVNLPGTPKDEWIPLNCNEDE